MGRVGGLWESLAPEAQTETVIELMLAEAMQTSAIEGEYLSRENVKLREVKHSRRRYP